MSIDGQGGGFDRASVGDVEGDDVLFCQDLEPGTLRTLFDQLKGSYDVISTIENDVVRDKRMEELGVERSILTMIRNESGRRWHQMHASEIVGDTLTDEQVESRTRWESIQSPETILRRLQNMTVLEDDPKLELDHDDYLHIDAARNLMGKVDALNR